MQLVDIDIYDPDVYVGGVPDFELVEPIVQHSKHLVETHFVG